MSRKHKNPSYRNGQRRLTLEALEDRKLMAGDLHPLTAVPQLQSKPDAPAAIYLDFDGHHEFNWGGFFDVDTPPYNIPGEPGDGTNFSDGELAAMEEIWKRVSEDYAPFNVNVTTVSPDALVLARTRERLEGLVQGAGQALDGVLPGDEPAVEQALADLGIPDALVEALSSWDGVAIRVAIGGHHEDWYSTDWFGLFGDDAQGVALDGSFDNLFDNTAYAFSLAANDSSQARSPTDLANTISHEAGHAFGLDHQGDFNSRGEWQDYGTNNDSTKFRAIMGNHNGAERSIWWQGFTDEDQDPGDFQNDVAVLTSVLGLRADDHGNAAGRATPLAKLGNNFEAKGIIESVQDKDFFSFTATGPIDIQVDVQKLGPNLDTIVQLQDAQGNVLVTKSSSDTSLGALLSYSPGVDPATRAYLTKEYRLLVKSRGTNVGDLGQYSVKVTPSGGPQVVHSQTEGYRNRARITFDKPIRPGTLTANVSVVDRLGVSIGPVRILAVPGTGGKTFDVWFPRSTYGGYKLTVRPNVMDLAGHKLDQDRDGKFGESIDDIYTWSDFTAPQLRGVPSLHANRKILVQFSEPMDPVTFLNSAKVYDANNAAVGVLGIRPVANSGVAFEIELARFPTRGYRLQLNDKITDLAGNRLAPVTRTHWDSVAPQFLRIPLAAPGFVQVTFNEPVQPGTFTAADVKIVNQANSQRMTITGVQPVTGSDGRSYYVRFNGGAGNYRMTVGPNILDLYGNRMTAAKQISCRADHWRVAESIPDENFLRQLMRIDTLGDKIPPELFVTGMRSGVLVRGLPPKPAKILASLDKTLKTALEAKGVDLETLDKYFAGYETQEAAWSTLLRSLDMLKSRHAQVKS